MSRIFLLATVFILNGWFVAQSQEENTSVHKIKLQQAAGKDSINYIDTAGGYRLTVPLWWKIMETPASLFGGTFPVVDSVENALVISSAPKSRFKDFTAFENWVIKSYSIMQNPAWSNTIKVLLKKEIDDFKDLGPAFKVQLLSGKLIYDCCYIMTETKSAYIWINFTATSTTYPKNFDRLKQIVHTFEKL